MNIKASICVKYCLMTLILIMTINQVSFSQDTKKIKIIKKTEKVVSDDGSDLDIDDVSDMDENGEFLTINVEKDNGQEVKEYTLTKIKDGKKEVIKWNGEGEMPNEIKDKIADVNVSEGNDKEINVMVETKGEDVKSDHPRKRKMHMMSKGGSDDFSWDEKKPDVSLGVMISDEGNGVIVESVNDGSAAEKGGIKASDKILKIEDDYIFGTKSLMESLNKFKKGDTAKIVVIRDNKEKKISVKF